MKANLHLHSRYSDGSLWPIKLVDAVKRVGLEYVALTDHDTMGGTEEFTSYCSKAGIIALPACEFDCIEKDVSYKSELLGYFPDRTFNNTKILLNKTLNVRSSLIQDYIYRAKEVFHVDTLSFEEVFNIKIEGAGKACNDRELSWNKVDLFMYLKHKNIIKQDIPYKDFKKAYFDTDLLRIKSEMKQTCVDIVKTIRMDGGIAVIPHIGHEFNDSLTLLETERKRLKVLLCYFWDIGVRGVELYFYADKPHVKMNEFIREEAKKIGYFFTYGSDCHGPNTTKHTIDKFFGEMNILPGFIN